MFIVNTIEGVVETAVDLVTGAVDIIFDIADFVVDEIIEPVVQGAGDIIQAALDDPITTIAKITAFATGNAWAIPMIDGAAVAASGGDVGDIIKATAVSYAGSKVGGTVSKFVDPAIAQAGYGSTVSAAISGGTKSAATALVYGQDPLQAFATGGINAGVGALLGDIDTKLSNAVEGQFDLEGNPIVSGWENLQDGVKDSITASLAAELEGGSISADTLGSIVSRYTGVAETMEKFLTDNTGVDAGQAALLTSALNSAAVTALAGNPELSGEVFFAKFDEAGMKELEAIVDKPVDKTIDKLTGAYGKTETAAAVLNEVMTKTANAADGFNGLRVELNEKIQEQDRLRGVYDTAVSVYNSDPSEANANRISDAAATFNTYANQLTEDYDNIYKPQMDAFQATYDEFNPQIEGLQAEYDDEVKYLMSNIDDLSSEMKPIFDDVTRASALALRPGFDEDAYRKLNELDADEDVYAHFLGEGQKLPATEDAVNTTMGEIRGSVIKNILADRGINIHDLESEQLREVGKYVVDNVKSLKSLTGLDFEAFTTEAVRLANKATPLGGAYVSAYPKADGVSSSDIASGAAVLTLEDDKWVWQNTETTAAKIESGYAPNTFNSNLSKKEQAEAAILSVLGGAGAISVRFPNWERIQKNRLSLPDMISNAVNSGKKISSALMTQIVELGTEAGELLNETYGEPIYTASKFLYDKYVSEDAQDAIGDVGSIVVGAGGETLKAIAGLSVIMGANPNNALGRVADNLIGLGRDMQSEEYTAALDEISGTIEDYDKEWREENPGKEPTWQEKTFLKAKAIYGAATENPVQFLGEYVAKEIIQEIPILLASGGVGTVAKRALLESGEAFANKVGTRAALGTALTLDATEAFGGTAGGAFDDAYATATKMGMSEQEATDYALDVAQKAGSIAVVTLLATAGIGGQALAKSVLGDRADNAAVEAFDSLFGKIVEGGKVTIKEGVTEGIEEALPQLYTATALAQIDPSYDVAGSVTAAAVLGKIAGSGTAGGIYSGNAVADTLLSVNSTVRDSITNSNSAEEASTALKSLGITDTTVLNNLLNSTYDTQYVSTSEAGIAFNKENPDYTPTDAEIESFVSNRSESDVATAIASYIDPKFLDADEVKAAAAAEGITLTDEQTKAYVGQKDETAAVAEITAEYDSQGTSRAEAEQFFADLGYTATEEEITARVGATPDAEQKTAIGEYVDPRQVTEAEARKFFEDQGYTPTDEEVAARVGQGDANFQDTTKTNTDTYIDPRQVTDAEARQYFADLGYTPTDEQVAQFVAQVAETEQSNLISQYVDPRQVTRDELQNIADEEGLTLTDALAAAYVGQGEAENFASETLATAKTAYDPLATTQEEAAAFFESTGYTATTEEIAEFVASKTEEVQNSAIGAYVDPRQMTSAEAEEFLSAIGYEPTQEEIDQFTGQVNDDSYQTTQQTAIDEYVDPRYVDAGEVRAAYEELGLVDVSQEDVDRFVGQFDEETQLEAVSDYLPTATFNVIKQIVGTPSVEDDPNTDADESKDATGLYASLEDGKTRDEALQDAIDGVAADLGTTKTELLAEIDLTESQLSDEIDVVVGDVSDLTGDVSDLTGDVADVTEDVGELADVIGTAGVEDDPDTEIDETQDPTGLYATIEAYEDAGIERDDAIQKAVDDVSTALGTTKTDLLSAIGETESTLSAEISGVEDTLTEEIGDVESTLTEEIGSVEETLGADIDIVADLVGKPAREVTQTDVDFVIDLIAQENVSQELTTQYDVNADGIVDIADQTMLETALQGDTTTLADTSIFTPATGLYAQQEQDTQATLDAITDMNTQINTQIDTNRKQANFDEFQRMLLGAEDLGGQQVRVTPGEKVQLDYMYDIGGDSIFATPQQAGMFASPFGGNRVGARPNVAANNPMGPMLRASGFAQGGQVEDENDMLLKLLGDL